MKMDGEKKVKYEADTNVYTMQVCFLKTAMVKNGFDAKNV